MGAEHGEVVLGWRWPQCRAHERSWGQRSPCAARVAVEGLRRLTTLLAAFELLVFDKLPGVPARTTPPQLFGRAAAGATVAVALRRRRGRASAGPAALAGAAVAVASTFATHQLRHFLIRLFGQRRLGGALSGVLEDLALLALGTRAGPPGGDVTALLD